MFYELWSLTAPRPFLRLLRGLCGAWEDLALALDVLELWVGFACFVWT